jgi:hypothetical protein
VFPLTRSTSRSRFFGLPFSPLALFAAGEQGAWYDPSDLTTLFQDGAGTTPVTAVEQPVRLMLDKSRGLVLGPELVVNGDFSNGTAGWITTGSATVSVVSGEAQVTNVTNFADRLEQGVVASVSGRTYRITATVRVSGGTGRLSAAQNGGSFGSLGFVDFTNTTAQQISFLATTTGGFGINIRVIPYAGGASQVVTVDNISVRELPGNHATAPSDAARPVLRGRVNLLTRTEEFDNTTTWSNATGGNTWQGTGLQPIVTANHGVAPDGTLTAERIQLNIGGGTTSNDRSGISASISVVVASYTAVFHVKPLDSTTDQQLLDSGNLGGLAAGPAPTSSSLVDVGNGWKRITRLYNITTAQSGTFRFQIVGAVGSPQTMDLLIWGADLRLTNDGAFIPPYQRVTTSTDYDTAGFPLYLAFDGTDDSMSTGTITPGTDKFQVFAGVRVLASANTAILLETSADAGSNTGSLFVAIPNTANTVTGLVRGATAGRTVSYSQTAPYSQVITMLADIAAPQLLIRSNQTQRDQNTADPGAINFQPRNLFIGARNNASLYFNGRVYGIILRFGSNASAAQIAAAEAWVNGKTRAY